MYLLPHKCIFYPFRKIASETASPPRPNKMSLGVRMRLRVCGFCVHFVSVRVAVPTGCTVLLQQYQYTTRGFLCQ